MQKYWLYLQLEVSRMFVPMLHRYSTQIAMILLTKNVQYVHCALSMRGTLLMAADAQQFSRRRIYIYVY